MKHGQDLSRFVAGIFGNAISLLLFLSPVPTMLRIRRNRSTEEFHPFPYLATVMNCMFWIFYGLPVVHPDSTLVVTINSVGLFLELIYLIIFFSYTTKKNRAIIISFLIGEIVLLAVVAAVTLLCFHTHDSRSMFVGIIGVVGGIIMYASPLSVIGQVVRSQNAEYMQFWLCLAGFSNGVVWFIYAFLKTFDPYIAAVGVTKEVNEWADKETNGLIKEVLPPGSVDASTRLILANAVYFKGTWNEKFDATETNDHEFFLLNGSSVKAPFMTSKKKQYVRAFDGFKVLGLPYKQGEDKRKFSMYIFLPDAKDGLPALIEKVSSGSGFIEHHLPLEQVKVGDFSLPKFKIAFDFEASEVLKGLGLVLPFSGGGLTEMVDSSMGQNLLVSDIFHKSLIEVNEEGTEAAAATAGVVKLRALLNEDKLDFVADHPFLFVLREDMTGVVLFIGQLVNPLAG